MRFFIFIKNTKYKCKSESVNPFPTNLHTFEVVSRYRNQIKLGQKY